MQPPARFGPRRTPGPRPARGAIVLGTLSSLALHLIVALALVGLPPAAVSVLPLLEIELVVDEVSDPTRAQGHAESAATQLVPGGRDSPQNVDAYRVGHGGDPTGSRAVVVLLPNASPITVQDSPLNSLRAAQTQRIRTAQDRATLEARRATPNPDDTPFLASGEGRFPERRPLSGLEPTAGARVAPAASSLGGAVGIATRAGDELSASGTAAGNDRASPGLGIVHARGTVASVRAPSARGRPPVDRGPAATHAEASDPAVRDDQDAELLASRLIQSMVDATRQRGRVAGAGQGGEGGGAAPGADGRRGAGGRATPDGRGSGEFQALDTSSRMYVRWVLELRRRVTEALEFPHDRALRMDQGVSLLRFSVRRDGPLAGTPELVRSSGFGDMDRAALAAVERAAPFPPPPDELAPHLVDVPVTMPIEFWNPLVR